MNKITGKLPTHCKAPILLFCVTVIATLIPLTVELANAANTTNQISGKTPPVNSKFAEIRQTVQGYFGRSPLYQKGDLIVRQETQKVLSTLQKDGIAIPDQQAILAKTLPEGDFLAKTLRGSRQGRAFMHQISSYPLAYAQLDRLRSQPVGRRTVTNLVRGPGGYKMLQYMNTSPQGKNLSRMLSRDKSGGNYNKPTGKIYTAEQLTNAIWEQIAPKNEKRR